MGSEGVKTKHKAIMFPYLDEMWYTTKKIKQEIHWFTTMTKNGNENIKCKMFSYDKCMRISRTQQSKKYDIQASNKVMWKCNSTQLKLYFILFCFILFLLLFYFATEPQFSIALWLNWLN